MAQKLQFFVAGLGRFGKSVAVTLEKMGYDVMAMDIDENVVQDLSDTLGYVVCADCSDERTWPPSAPAMRTWRWYRWGNCRRAS